MKHFAAICTMALLFTACSSNPDDGTDAINNLSSPSFSLSGAGTNQIGSTSYLFANSVGTIVTSNNSILATFNDTGLATYSSAFFDQLSSGSCTSLPTLSASVSGGSSNVVNTQVSATGCTDQTVIDVLLDTTQVFDGNGYSGDDILSAALTVDLAPTVATVATGNTAVDGSGTTNATPGIFALASDNSIVVNFSKVMTSGTWTATLTGCAATLGTPVAVASSNGQGLAWPLNGFSGLSSGATCTLNVSAVTDTAGNPEDPSDAHSSMVITFQ